LYNLSSFTKKNASGLLAWGVSILIHVCVIIIFLFAAGVFSLGGSRRTEVLSVTIEGDPSKVMGTAQHPAHDDRTSVSMRTGEAPSSMDAEKSGAKTPASAATGEGGGTGLGVKDTYIGQVLRKIHSNKYYPVYAQKRGLTGVVKLKFTLKKDGSLKGLVQKINSSGQQILDEAGIKAISSAAPFAPFPDDIRDDELNFVVDIDFVL
jgi:TonB family protein